MVWAFAIGCGISDVVSTAPRSALREPVIHEVSCDGSATFTTIDEAIDASHSGDTIRVAPCSYFGSVDFGGRTIRVESSGGPAVTTVYSTPGKPVLEIDDGEGPGTAFVGFTLTGGGGVGDPAINVNFSNLRLENTVVLGNQGIQALHSRSSHTEIVGCTFSQNTGTENIGVYAQRGFLLWKDSHMVCDGLGIGVQISHGGMVIDGGSWTCPGATAIHNEHSVGRVQRVRVEGVVEIVGEFGGDLTVVENALVLGGITADGAELELRNSIVLGGALALGDGVDGIIEGNIFGNGPCAVTGSTAGWTVRNNNFWDSVDPHCGSAADFVGTNDNIAADPLFVDVVAQDVHLSVGSPSIDTGPVGAEFLDVDGSANDMGVYGGPFTQAGGW